MIALDTNVLVRLITRDDPAEAEAAAEVMRSGTLWLPKTVVLELTWVLGYTYELDRQSIAFALERLMGLAHLRVEDGTAVALAVRCFGQGMDFADALHLASSEEAVELVTFDRKLASKARQIQGLTPVRLLGGLSCDPAWSRGANSRLTPVGDPNQGDEQLDAVEGVDHAVVPDAKAPRPRPLGMHGRPAEWVAPQRLDR